MKVKLIMFLYFFRLCMSISPTEEMTAFQRAIAFGVSLTVLITSRVCYLLKIRFLSLRSNLFGAGQMKVRLHSSLPSLQ